MLDYAEITKSLGGRGRFPAVGTAAYFRPTSQTIHLVATDAEDLTLILDTGDMQSAREPLCTIWHEITHWADLVSTIWGRAYLRRIYSALDLLDHVDTGGYENLFHEFVDLHDETRRLMLPEYYTTLLADAAPHSVNKPWGIEFSAGQEFDPYGRLNSSRPIIFVKFLDQDDRTLIVRQPLTVGALIESIAVTSELQVGGYCISQMEAGTAAVEQALWSKTLKSMLYHEELTLYTAPVHLLAHYARIIDLMLAYQLSALVAHVVLNMVEADFAALKIPDLMSPWANLIDAFKKSQNRGFAYAVVCANSVQWSEGVDAATWLDDALKKSALPRRKLLLENSKLFLRDAAEKDLSEVSMRSLHHQLDVGEALFDRRMNDPAVTPHTVGNVPTPPIFDCEGRVFGITPDVLDSSKYNPLLMHALEYRLDKWTTNFLSSCR